MIKLDPMGFFESIKINPSRRKKKKKERRCHQQLIPNKFIHEMLENLFPPQKQNGKAYIMPFKGE